METRVHPVTGKALRRDVRAQVVSLGSVSRTVGVPGWYPEDDSDPIHSGADLAESDRAFRELRATGAACGDEVR